MRARMAEPTMPQVRSGDVEKRRRRRWSGANKGVEVAVTNGDHEYSPSAKILHKKTTREKFN